MIFLNKIIYGDDFVIFGRFREIYVLGRVGSYLFCKGRRYY